MVKASLGINILAVLPLASNATSAVSAAMIAPAIMARTESKYFRIVFFRSFRIFDFQTGLRGSHPAWVFFLWSGGRFAYFSAKRSYASAILSNRSLKIGAEADFACLVSSAALVRQILLSVMAQALRGCLDTESAPHGAPIIKSIMSGNRVAASVWTIGPPGTLFPHCAFFK